MMALLNTILILLIAFIGLSFILGGYKPERLARLVIWIILAPLALCFVQTAVYGTYASLSPFTRLAFLILLPLVLLVILRFIFPHTRWLIDVLLNVLVYLLTLPVRILWRSIRLISQRERHTIELSDTPVVVGRRPQFHDHSREEGIFEDDNR